MWAGFTDNTSHLSHYHRYYQRTSTSFSDYDWGFPCIAEILQYELDSKRQCTAWCRKCCLACSSIIRDNIFCCRGSQGQVILPLSSYDSSLIFSEMFPPLHFLPFLTLSQLSIISFCFSSFHPVPPQTSPLAYCNPWRCELHHELNLQPLFGLHPSLFFFFYTATMCLQLMRWKNILTDRSARWETKRQKKREERRGGMRRRGWDE